MAKIVTKSIDYIRRSFSFTILNERSRLKILLVTPAIITRCFDDKTKTGRYVWLLEYCLWLNQKGKTGNNDFLLFSFRLVIVFGTCLFMGCLLNDYYRDSEQPAKRIYRRNEGDVEAIKEKLFNINDKYIVGIGQCYLWGYDDDVGGWIWVEHNDEDEWENILTSIYFSHTQDEHGTTIIIISCEIHEEAQSKRNDWEKNWRCILHLAYACARWSLWKPWIM